MSRSKVPSELPTTPLQGLFFFGGVNVSDCRVVVCRPHLTIERSCANFPCLFLLCVIFSVVVSVQLRRGAIGIGSLSR